MRIVFAGTPEFAVPCLRAAASKGEVVAVYTQPDRPAGRGRGLTPSPVKLEAVQRGIPVHQPETFRKNPAARAELRALEPDVAIVMAYGQILPRAVLDLAPRGALNLHASLLPRYRGAAPIQWAIARGESQTGVTTMQLDEGLDTGPILMAQATSIGPLETAGELEGRLAGIGAELLLETLDGLASGGLQPRPRDHALATLAPILQKEDGRVDWSRPASEIGWRVRGFQPWPGMTATWQAQGLKLLRVAEAPAGPGAPGEILEIGPSGVLVACGGGTRLWLAEVQPESRRAIPAVAWAAGARIRPGVRLA